MKAINDYLNESISDISNFGEPVNPNNCPKVFYHATIKNKIASIKKFGLGGKIPRKRFWDYDETYKNINRGVFLATDEYVAYDFIDACNELYDEYEDFDESWIRVYEINTSDLDLSHLYIDTNNDNEDDPTYFYDGIIPYEKLKLIKLS